MTLLSLVNNAQDALSLPRSSAVAGALDQNTRTMLSLANREGKQLARRYAWQAITKEKTFTSIAAETQTNAIPSDFDRLVNESMYNRSQKRWVLASLSSTEWQTQKAITATVITDSFRIRGDALLLLPTPPAGDTYAYEYVSKNWCESSGATEQAAWAADTDTGILDEELMTLGLIWRFKKAKELDYAEDFATYEKEVNQAIMRDGGRRTLSFANRGDLYEHAPRPSVPEGSWSL